jgi:hypothetical protein
MDPKIVDKVIDEASGYDITSIDVGESGDSFLNPQVINILRSIRSRFHGPVRMFTNFQTFTPDKIDAVLEEGLLDRVIANVDGANPDTYRAVKGLDLKTVESNILYFLKRKEELNRSIYFRVQSLTLHHYASTVRRVLGRAPLHVPEELLDVEDDFEDIVAQWKPRGIIPQRSIVTLWAEAASTNEGAANMRNLSLPPLRRIFPKPCRLLDRIKDSFFVMPAGEVYLCCADFDFELIIGDVTTQTVEEIVKGERRRKMITALSRRRFDEIGGPCLRSDLCRIY